MDSLETASQYGFDPQQSCPLGSPVTRAPRSIFLASNYDERNPRSSISLCRIVDAHCFARRLVSRHTAFSARNHQVFDAHIRKGAAGHHSIISAPRTVAVEVR